MPITLKTPAQVEQIKENGRILRDIVNRTVHHTVPGHSTKNINSFIEKLFKDHEAIPTFKGYKGFPGSACISVNDVYVHGIPHKKHKIAKGDIISIDIGVTKNGCVADSCYTFVVGNELIKDEHKELIKTAHDATMLGIEKCAPGVRIHDIAKEVYEFVESTDKFTVVEGLYGHGTGKELHEPPTIPFTYPPGTPNVRLKKDMVITIEPVIGYKSSKGKFKEDSDKWTLRSLDGTPGAQFEHTLAITEEGHEILTGEFMPFQFED